MSTRNTYTVVIFGITYALIGVYLLSSSENFSEELFKRIIFAVSISSFFLTTSELFGVGVNYLNLANFSKKRSESFEDIGSFFLNLQINKTYNLSFYGKFMNFMSYVSYYLAIFFSMFLIFYDISPSSKWVGTVSVSSFGFYIAVKGLEEGIYALRHSSIILKASFNLKEKLEYISHNVTNIPSQEIEK